jgi:hypothetical protein
MRPVHYSYRLKRRENLAEISGWWESEKTGGKGKKKCDYHQNSATAVYPRKKTWI